MKPAQIKQVIDDDHATRVKSTAMFLIKDGEKAKFEKQQAEDNLKRQYLNDHRPPVCWNFFEDGAQKVKHILRFDANPYKCYSDGRVEKVMTSIYDMGEHL